MCAPVAISEIFTTPPLKWAGGKRWLTPTLARLWQPHARHRRLVEPFVGGAAVALGLQPQRALLNDMNPHLVNFYRWLQRGLHVRVGMANERALYYEQRARFNELATNGGAETAEAASLFYYLNRTGYNGLCRFNRKGEFNVPFGQYKTINYTRDFTPYAAALAGWQFSTGDFNCLPIEPDDFIYADPPYDVEFTTYSSGGFSWADQERLAAWLAAHPGPVVASNQATTRVLKLYREHGFQVEIIQAPRMINCTGDRTRAGEMLAHKNF
ncbi:MAG: Dam family site-specific DNA-(adenine-N6)-methyltransferase [Acidobacteriota bacterium]|nr:Dam family site-specific DNA-(adenine-N6)-methyltransferase [Acidobacteriota bacterium]